MAVHQAVIFCLIFAMPLLSSVSAFRTCNSYTDGRGIYHSFVDCGRLDYCCGTCGNRYCCGDLFKVISNLKQDNCLDNLSGGQTFLIIFCVIVVLIVVTIIVCALRPGCPLYKIRMRRSHHTTGAVIHTYPGNQPAPYLGPQPIGPYPGGPPPQATPYPGPQPIPGVVAPCYPPTAGYNPTLTPSAPPASAPYGAPGQPQAAYPPPGQMSYSQPGFAPGQPAFYPQPQAPPQPSYMVPPPPYPTS